MLLLQTKHVPEPNFDSLSQVEEHHATLRSPVVCNFLCLTTSKSYTISKFTLQSDSWLVEMTQSLSLSLILKLVWAVVTKHKMFVNDFLGSLEFISYRTKRALLQVCWNDKCERLLSRMLNPKKLRCWIINTLFYFSSFPHLIVLNKMWENLFSIFFLW